ncbi:hypothetical protein ACIBI9_50610 [Nonomuraea sp. NPDC050451]|uniref:hypothetical protein n=1 Tax=Nonomuraea sp. NPDC050451 TaxID=3364364 RepID=UPI0037BAB3C9
MNSIVKFAAVLAISTIATVIGGSSSPALADGHPVIDIIDDVAPNAEVLSNLLPNMNVAPSILCIPTASNSNDVKGNNNQTTTNQTNNCTQSTQQTAPPPPDNGGDGITGYEVVNGPTDNVPPNSTVALQLAQCPAGKKATGGGFIASGAGNDGTFAIQDNALGSGSGWVVTVTNTTNDPAQARAIAVCVDAQS